MVNKVSSLKHTEDLVEYITKRKEAFESKLGYGENPIPDMHFCNNSKYLDSLSQRIAKTCHLIKMEGGDLRDQLFNLACYRFLIDRVFIDEMTEGTGVFKTENFPKYAEYIDNVTRRPKGRYRLVLQNDQLWGRTKKDLFVSNIPNVVDVLEGMVGLSQSEVWKSPILKGVDGVADFTAYQFSSDLLFIEEMNIKPDYVEYHNAGTGKGFEILTGSKAYDKVIIDMILDINSKLDHKTEYTRYMIPSDACNVLCEFKKYMSGKKRSRSANLSTEYVTKGETDYELIWVPNAIKDWSNGHK